MAAYTVSAGWRAIGQIGLNQAIDATSTVQLEELGKRVRCKDTAASLYGNGEFIYLTGVTSTVAGSLVLITAANGTSLAATRNIGSVGVACSANAASTSYGWYQIKGAAMMATGTCDINLPVYVGASGVGDTTAVAGDLIEGAISRTAADTATAIVLFGCNPTLGDADNSA